MAASLHSTRPVAKAVLPNRVGRLGHRLSERILTMKARPRIPLSPNEGFVICSGEVTPAWQEAFGCLNSRPQYQGRPPPHPAAPFVPWRNGLAAGAKRIRNLGPSSRRYRSFQTTFSPLRGQAPSSEWDHEFESGLLQRRVRISSARRGGARKVSRRNSSAQRLWPEGTGSPASNSALHSRMEMLTALEIAGYLTVQSSPAPRAPGPSRWRVDERSVETELCRTSEAAPDERGGNRYVRPTATAPHFDPTHFGPLGSSAAANR
jgi:hypothetical protein